METALHNDKERLHPNKRVNNVAFVKSSMHKVLRIDEKSSWDEKIRSLEEETAEVLNKFGRTNKSSGYLGRKLRYPTKLRGLQNEKIKFANSVIEDEKKQILCNSRKPSEKHHKTRIYNKSHDNSVSTRCIPKQNIETIEKNRALNAKKTKHHPLTKKSAHKLIDNNLGHEMPTNIQIKPCSKQDAQKLHFATNIIKRFLLNCCTNYRNCKDRRNAEDYNDRVDPWIEVKNEEEIWYYNKLTGKSTWEKPYNYTSSLDPPKSSLFSSRLLAGQNAHFADGQSNFFPSTSACYKDNLNKTFCQNEETLVPKLEPKRKEISIDKKNDEQADVCLDDIDNGSINLEEERKRIFFADGKPNCLLRDEVNSALKPSSCNTFSTFHDSINDEFTEKKDFYMITNQHKSIFRDVEKNRMISVLHSDGSTCDKGFRNHDHLNSQNKCTNRRVSVESQSVYYDESLGSNKTSHTRHSKVCQRLKDGIAIEKKTDTKCINCWSLGNGKMCFKHAGTEQEVYNIEAGSILMCKNWDMSVLQRRYRSEDIQEKFMKKFATLQYDTDHKQFQYEVELKHPIYKLVAKNIAKYNFRNRCKLRLKYWFRSLVNSMLSGKITGKKAASAANIIRLKKSCRFQKKLRKLALNLQHTHPTPPVTGTSFMEKNGSIQIIFEKTIVHNGLKLKRKYIVDGTPPTPKALYRPRKYEKINSVNIFLPDLIQNCSENDDLIDQHLKKESQTYRLPSPFTKRSAIFRSKQADSSQGVGGLNAELILSQVIDMPVPPRYEDITIMDKTILTPTTNTEFNESFRSIQIEYTSQSYVERPLDHPLNHRKAPTVTIVVGLDPCKKNFLGNNRPKQTGEHENFGFRTSDWAPIPYLDSRIDTNAFIPAHDIVTANTPRRNKTITTRANNAYPLRISSSHKTSTMDYYHLLQSNGMCSPNKPQTFTCFGIQNPGQFMRGCDPNRPFGQFFSKVIRNWMYNPKSDIEKFETKDGIPYWYDHKSGETFWECPLHNHFFENEAFHHSEERILIKDNTLKRNNLQRNNDEISNEIFQTKTPSPSIVINLENNDVSIKETCNDHNKRVKYEEKDDNCKIPNIDEVANVMTKDNSQQIENKNEGTEQKKNKKEKESEVCSKSLSSTSDLKIREDSKLDLLIQSISNAIGEGIENVSSPKDMLQFGMGIGMSLGAQGLLNITPTHLNQATKKPSLILKHGNGEGETQDNNKNNNIEENDSNEEEKNPKKTKALDLVKATKTIESTSILDHTIEKEQAKRGLLSSDEYNPLEDFKGRVPVESEILSNEAINKANSDKGKGSAVITRKFAPLQSNYETHNCKSLVSAFVRSKNTKFLNKVRKDTDIELRKSEKSIPTRFFSSVGSKNVCKQHVDYLPVLPNLPKCKPVGRVKPRSVGDDWLAVGFDPWSAGKEALGIEFISTLPLNDEMLKGEKRPAITGEPFISLVDQAGISEQNRITNEANLLEQNFREACGFVRHGNYKELEEKMNEPDWNLPIDYTDQGGNTLLAISCQNGHKRIAKLCLRMGSNINHQNLSGQTCLHYAFGYGFGKLRLHFQLNEL